ncbi:MAG: serine/threonine protein kinase, partial [Gammaproteobacteria bacterium]
MRRRAMDPQPGQTLGSYVITERLVAGGMAKVYRARQASTGREVAVKVLTLDADPDLRARFEHEARVLAALQHPHILSLIDAGREGEWLYLVMPLVRCGDLADLIAREDGPLPLPLLRRAILQLCSALDYAHGQGVVHRDIKPANVLLDERGNCLLTDFGIALSADAKRLTVAGFYIGTPEYLPPEQSAGQADARSDLYSLGIVLFQMATGRLPFAAHTPLDWLRAHSDTPVPPARSINADLPPEKALAKAPAARYQNAAQFAAAIREALPEARYGEGVEASDVTKQASPASASAALPIGRIAAVAIIGTLVVTALLLAQPWRNAASPPAAAIPAASAAPAASAPIASIAPTAPPSTNSAPPATASLFDRFNDPRFEGRFDPTRWHLTKADARIRIEQHDGTLHIRSQEREHGVYAEIPAAALACASARLRLDAPVLAREASLGITLSRADRPGEWVSCYLYATQGASRATPSCTDQRRQEFRSGDASDTGSWHSVALRVDNAHRDAYLSADGRVLGTLPAADASAATAWYLLLSGWSSDGQPVEGAIAD